MLWLPIALLAPAFSALGNYIDKYLLVSHKTGGAIGAITIFSCLFACIVLPLSYFLSGEIMSVGFLQAMILIVNGFLSVSALLFYLYAIDRDSVLLSIPILQAMPVFAFVLGYFILGETLSLQQALGSFIVIGAAVLFSLEINSWKDISLKKSSLFFIVAASLPLAAVGVIFKWAALDIGYWTTQFWEYVGIAIFGLILFVFARAYRQSFFPFSAKNLTESASLGSIWSLRSLWSVPIWYLISQPYLLLLRLYTWRILSILHSCSSMGLSLSLLKPAALKI